MLNDNENSVAKMSQKLKGKTGRRYWKSLEQLARTPEFEKWADGEFPYRHDMSVVDRRGFLKLMGASLMLAGLGAAGCRKLPEDRLVPFISGPEGRIHGKPVYYASISSCGGYSIGLKVKTYEGRPIKLDGNPNHPSSLGGIDARTQARVLDLYDPDRLKLVKFKREASPWSGFLKAAREKLVELGENDGAGIVLLTETVGSPTMHAQITAFQQKYPAAKWVQYEPVNRDNALRASQLAFGQVVDTHYRFDRAKVILSLDSNVMMEGPGSVRYQRDIMASRSLVDGRKEMSRIYAVEGATTTLGVVADHRLPLRPSQIFNFTKALAARLGMRVAGPSSTPRGVDEKWITAVANDLLANPQASVVVTGEHQSGAVHALVHAINEHLDNVGHTVIHTEPVMPNPTEQVKEMAGLTARMNAGQVDMLLVIGGNPVFTAPADLEFGSAMGKVAFCAHLSNEENETGAKCDWQLAKSHFLESWSDGRAHDGTTAIQQPMIEPLYDSVSGIELIDSLLGTSREGMDIVKGFWNGAWGEEGFDKKWRHALADGVIEDSTAPEVAVRVSPAVSRLSEEGSDSGHEVVFLPDPTIYDGRFANNGWLQELPKPISNLTWDNAAYMSHSTAVGLNIEIDKRYGFIPADREADIVSITVDGRSVEAAVYVNHGMAEGVVLVHMGYGRTIGGTVMLPSGKGKGDPSKTGGGFNAFAIRTSQDPWIVADGARIKRTDKTYPLANAQFHNTIDMTVVDSDRDILREMTLDEFLHPDEEHAEEGHDGENPSMFKEDMLSRIIPGMEESAVQNQGWDYKNSVNYQWAMTIDLALCTGCNACVIACQSENNIPTVGKYQVQRGRELHWIRIDRYYAGQGDESEWPVPDPVIRFQPMTCQQCENAPCEPVCPVAATTHSKEGLNQMIYNRCVGTRYCSNNCPYKVRRFNFLNYGDHHDLPVKMLLNNPDVTVRHRGVMEKCTYCVQRISAARITAKMAGGKIPEGGVVTACQQACPSKAIVFGDMRDPESAIGRSLASSRSYKVLDKELNTRPRTTYLARVNNPNKELDA